MFTAVSILLTTCFISIRHAKEATEELPLRFCICVKGKSWVYALGVLHAWKEQSHPKEGYRRAWMSAKCAVECPDEAHVELELSLLKVASITLLLL